MSKDPAAVIGEPTKVEFRKGKGLYLEAKLYPDSEMAKKAYELARVLNQNSTKRQLGWSIEGKVVERDPKNPSIVLKSKITGCALTPMPINPNTFVNIIKGFTEDDADVSAIEAVQSEGNGGGTKILMKSIEMGEDTITITKSDDEYTIKMKKSLNTTSGAPVIPESVEGGTKPKKNPAPKKDKEKDLDKMSKSEAYEYMFASNPSLSINEAKKAMRIVEKNKAL